jgi:hypothetical protein
MCPRKHLIVMLRVPSILDSEVALTFAAMKASARMYEAGRHACVNQGQVRRTARRKKEEESRLQGRSLDWMACRWHPLRSEERSRGKYY